MLRNNEYYLSVSSTGHSRCFFLSSINFFIILISWYSRQVPIPHQSSSISSTKKIVITLTRHHAKYRVTCQSERTSRCEPFSTYTGVMFCWYLKFTCRSHGWQIQLLKTAESRLLHCLYGMTLFFTPISVMLRC